MYANYPKTRYYINLIFIHCIIPLLIGGMIYIAFRANTLLMFEWFDSIGLKEQILSFRHTLKEIKHITPSWIYYSLPDGLWMYSFSSAILIYWKNDYKSANTWLLIPFFCGVFVELLQGIKLFPGTFDYNDILFSILGMFFSKKILIN